MIHRNFGVRLVPPLHPRASSYIPRHCRSFFRSKSRFLTSLALPKVPGRNDGYKALVDPFMACKPSCKLGLPPGAAHGSVVMLPFLFWFRSRVCCRMSYTNGAIGVMVADTNAAAVPRGGTRRRCCCASQCCRRARGAATVVVN